jgi:dTDP-glucose 4,6-dehydratase/UDP-glucose 4-epimerase
MLKRYLVTGGTGFIGSELVKRLVQEKHFVRVLDNNSRGAITRLKDVIKEIEFVDADIRDTEAVIRSAKKMDSILHLAYVNGTEFFYSQPELVLDIAIRGMLNIVDACRKQDVGELILASSSEVYQTPPMIPAPEDIPLVVPDVMNPRYSYGGGKLACELMAINFGRKYLDRALIFRPHNVYGKDMGFEHVIPQLAMRSGKLAKAQPKGTLAFEIQGDGTETRAFVHVDDFTAGLMIILEKGEHLNIYNIGNDEEVSIRTVIDHMFDHFGRDYKLISGELLKGSVRRRCPNINKLKSLGYSPKIPLKEGILEVIDWYVDYATKAND